MYCILRLPDDQIVVKVSDTFDNIFDIEYLSDKKFQIKGSKENIPFGPNYTSMMFEKEVMAVIVISSLEHAICYPDKIVQYWKSEIDAEIPAKLKVIYNPTIYNESYLYKDYVNLLIRKEDLKND